MARCSGAQRIELPADLQRAGSSSATYKDIILVFGGRKGEVFFNDLWAFKPSKGEAYCLCKAAPFPPRANHTCTVVRDALWVIGGSSATDIFRDVQVYDLKRREWLSAPTTKLRGAPQLLHRTAHAACLFPLRDDTITIYGGYGCPDSAGGQHQWLGDLVTINTLTCHVAPLDAGGTLPVGRGYHTLTVSGQRCYVVGGRGVHNKLLVEGDAVAVYDLQSRKWLPSALAGSGSCSTGSLEPRSSHRAVALECGDLVVFGGSNSRGRLDDFVLLRLDPASGRVSWQEWMPAAIAGAGADDKPSARGAHCMELLGGSLFILGGYAGNTKSYVQDSWRLDIAGPEPPAPAPREQDGCARPSGEASQWRQARRGNRSFAEGLGGGSGAAHKRPRTGGSGGGRTPDKGTSLLLGSRSPAKAAPLMPNNGPTAATPAAAAVAVTAAATAPVLPLPVPPPATAVPPEPLAPVGHPQGNPAVCAATAAAALAAEVGTLRAAMAGRQGEELAALQAANAGLRAELELKARELDRRCEERRASEERRQEAERAAGSLERALEEERERGREALARRKREAEEALSEQAVIFGRERDALAAAAREKDAALSRLEAELEAQRAQARRERAEWESTYTSKQRQVERLSLDVEVAINEQKKFSDQYANAMRSIERLQAQRDEDAQALAAARRQAAEDREQLLAKLAAASTACEGARRDAEGAKAQLASLKEALQAAQAAMDRLQAQLTQQEQRAQRGEAEAQQSQQEAARLRSECAKVRDVLGRDKAAFELHLRAANTALAALAAAGGSTYSLVPD